MVFYHSIKRFDSPFKIMKKKSPVKKTRNRKPGMKSTDGMKVKNKSNRLPKTSEFVAAYNKTVSVEYKILSEGGVRKLFDTPESLWEAACDYFEWVKDNPWVKNDWKDGRLVQIPMGRPMTIMGMCIHMGVNSEYYRNFRNNLSEKDKVRFSSVIKNIDDAIYTQKFEGAAMGAFNATIISRDLGLREQTDVTTGGEKINKAPIVNVYNTAPPLVDDEAKIKTKN